MKAFQIFLLAITLTAGMALDSEGAYGWIALATALTSALLLLCTILVGDAKNGKGGER